LSESLRAVVEREAMGQPLARSLDSWAAEHDGPDVRLVATVFQMHRRSGGDLPTVLDGVAATLRERAAQAREAQSLTAQARLSGIVLGFLPVGFFCFLSIMSPGDMSAAYQTPAGITAITAGILLQAGAFFWIRHLLRAEA
jgi:tight adherence protein B